MKTAKTSIVSPASGWSISPNSRRGRPAPRRSPGSAPMWSRSRTPRRAIPAVGCGPENPTTTRGTSPCSTPTNERWRSTPNRRHRHRHADGADHPGRAPRAPADRQGQAAPGGDAGRDDPLHAYVLRHPGAHRQSGAAPRREIRRRQQLALRALSVPALRLQRLGLHHHEPRQSRALGTADAADRARRADRRSALCHRRRPGRAGGRGRRDRHRRGRRLEERGRAVRATVARVVLISLDGFASFYWTDPRVRMPTLRRLAERGVVARRMECVFPSTTWPTHASMVTGVRPDRHGVVANYILNRESGRAEDLTGDPIYDADRLLRAPTVYDVAHAAGRRTAAVDWPCTRRAAGLDFNLPFFKDQRVFESTTHPDVWRELGALGLPIDRLGEWSQLPKRFLRDGVVADAAAHVLHRHAPDLILVHFLCADSFQHLHGPRSPEAYWALEYVDHCVDRVLAALPTGALERDTAVLVVSDHGFLPCDHEIRVNVRLRQLGLVKVDGEGRITESRARFVTNHGTGYVYILDPADRASLVHDLKSDLAALEGVTGVLGVADYAGLGAPSPDENPMMGELVLEAAHGYAFGDEARGDDHLGPPRYRGNHGHRPGHPDNGAFFLAAGAGIRRGAELGAIMSRDVAPSVAHLLAVKLGDVEGTLVADALV